jgi:hypothetical protein
LPYYYKRITHRPTGYRNKVKKEEFPSKKERKKEESESVS